MEEPRERKPLEKPDLYVVGRFLERLWQPDTEYTRADLQRAVRLNYDLFVRYLAWLEGKGFVRVVPRKEGSDVVRITKEGVEAHRRLVEWIRQVLGDSVL